MISSQQQKHLPFHKLATKAYYQKLKQNILSILKLVHTDKIDKPEDPNEGKYGMELMDLNYKD